MSKSDSLTSNKKVRRDGWTTERQLRFLDSLERTRSVTKAARAAGMSRESAYRLRARAGNALFAAAWDKALRAKVKGHNVHGRAGRIRRLRSAVSRANPPKVTKCTKFATSRFDAFDEMLRDLLNHSVRFHGRLIEPIRTRC